MCVNMYIKMRSKSTPTHFIDLNLKLNKLCMQIQVYTYTLSKRACKSLATTTT